MQPQVEGFITRIAVKSGDRVAAGALLMEIDSRSQQAGDLPAWSRSGRSAQVDVTYAQQEAERAQKLLDAGAASQMDADRAANALKAAEAQLRTVEEQIRSCAPTSATTASPRPPPASSATFRSTKATA